MAYIGKTPITGNFVKLDAISVVNGQAAYTMNNGGSAFTDYETVNQFLVSLNGILQAPTTSFTVSGSTLTFASNLATGDVIDFVIVLGNTLDIGTPSDATVTDAKANFVSTSSAAGLQIKGDGTTDGTLQLNCSQNSHGIKLKSPAHSAGASYTLTFPTTDGNNEEFLQTNGSGVLTWASAGGGITTAGQWRVNTDFTMTGQQDNVITSNWEENDTTYARLGSAMSESSGVFTFPETGIYLVRYVCNARYAGDDAHIWAKIQLTTNNSSYSVIAQSLDSIEQVGGSTTYANVVVEAMIDISNVSTHKVKFSVQPQSSSSTFSADSAINLNTVTFIRLGDT